MTLFELGYYNANQVERIKKKLNTPYFKDYNITSSGIGDKHQIITVSSDDPILPEEALKNLFLNYCLSLLAS